MPDDERTRRRVSDETRGRIADLASGWSVETDTPPPEATPVPRARPKTLPPPPPGSKARSALEDAILGAELDSGTTTDDEMDALLPTLGPRGKPVPASPPAAPLRKPPTAPPPPQPVTRTPTQPPPSNLPSAAPYTGAIQRLDDSGILIAPAPKGFVPRDDESGVLVAPAPKGFVPRTDESGIDAAPGKGTKGAKGTKEPKERDKRGRTTSAEPVAPRAASVTSAQPVALVIVPPPPIVPPAPPPPRPPPVIEAPPPPPPRVEQTEPIPIEDLLEEDESESDNVRGDPTHLDSSTTKFERGDPTNMGRDDISVAPSRARVGRLRTVAALRRQRGVFGDVRYVATVMFGVRRSRRELSKLELQQESRQAERDRYLVTLGRAAVVSEGFDHPALGPSREKLGEIEDERARHHAQVGAADQELQRVMQDREARAKQYTIDLSAVDAELAELTKRLEPLNKDQAVSTRKAADLRGELRRLDKEIAETTSSLVSVKPGKKDPAEIQAELATLKADRIATQKDEPRIAAELDSLSPKIAALDAKKSESTKKRADMVKGEESDKRRAEELLAAIGAKRKVMDRAANDAETLRDKILFELAERLYVDRPRELSSQLAPIDAIDVELGSADRRVMELREILSSVDRWKLWRGIAVIVVFLAATGAFGGWLYYMLG